VSCFYKVKSKHKLEEYLVWLKNFLEIPMNLIIFLDQFKDHDIYSYIMNIRKDMINKTLIIDRKIEDMNTYKHSDYWNYCYSIDSEKYHSPELYMLWNEKTYMVEESIRINPYNSDWFFWVDMGCCRNNNRHFLNFPNYNVVKNYDKEKIIISFIEKIKSSDYNLNDNGIPNIFQNKSNDMACDPVVRVQAGFFGGHVNGWKVWIDNFNTILNQFINYKVFGGKEQNIMSTVAIKYKDNIQPFYPDRSNGDMWFDFLAKFS
jgi:hypothetical protein